MGLGTFADWIQLGAFGVVSVAFLWGLMKGFPKILDKYTDALSAFMEEIQKERSSREEMRERHILSLHSMQSKHLEAMQSIGEECHNVQRESHAVLERTREALVRVESTLDRQERERRTNAGLES